MNDIDFSVTALNHVIRRKPDCGWHKDRLFYQNEFDMVIALDGKAEYIIDSERIYIKKNDILIFPPGIIRTGYTNKSDPWEFITINFNLALNKEAADFFNKKYVCFENQGMPFRSKFLDIAYLWSEKKALYALKCKSIIFDILYELIRAFLSHKQTVHAERLEAARTYVQANFRNKISIDKLARDVGFSPSYFRKIFTEAYGRSPQKYVTALRIDTAYDLLRSGDVNVSEAAFLSGFDDIYYFSATFKKYKGISPSGVLQMKGNDNSIHRQARTYG